MSLISRVETTSAVWAEAVELSIAIKQKDKMTKNFRIIDFPPG
jgi:hypothetical protein